jgi:hypothetical protein
MNDVATVRPIAILMVEGGVAALDFLYRGGAYGKTPRHHMRRQKYVER